MAAPRNLSGVLKDEESAAYTWKEDDSPTGKRPKLDRFPLTRWELAAAVGIFLVCSGGLFCIYLTMPAAEFDRLKFPRTISDLRMLK